MGNPMAPSYLALRDLELLKSRSLRFLRIISRKEAELGHMLLFKANRKPYMGSPTVP